MAPRTRIYAFLEIEESHYVAGVASFNISSDYTLFALMGDSLKKNAVPVVKSTTFPDNMSKGAEAYFANKPNLRNVTVLSTSDMHKVVYGFDGFNAAATAILGAMDALTNVGSSPRLIVAFEEQR